MEMEKLDASGESKQFLNDFCLLQILNRLHVSDLCSTAGVNKQFRSVAIKSFTGRYATTFCYPEDAGFFFPHSCESYKKRMRHILCVFGHLMKSLDVRDFSPVGVFTGPRMYPIEMDVISRYCSETLVELNLNIFLGLNIDGAMPLFSKLKTLRVSGGGTLSGNELASSFSDCRELKTLVAFGAAGTETLQHYPNLEHLKVGHRFIAYNMNNTAHLLRLNPHIKTLYLEHANVSTTVCAVAEKMVNLEELILKYPHRDISNINELSQLKSLKVLELHSVPDQFSIEMMEDIPLERLKWFDCPTKLEFIDHITKLKTLKHLTLTDICIPFDDALVALGERLPQLEELELRFSHHKSTFFTVDYLQTIVERASKLTVLTIDTVHTSLFTQTFFDSLLGIIRKRPSSSVTKFRLAIYDYVGTPDQPHSELLEVKFLATNYCTCHYCDPQPEWEWDEDDYDDYVDLDMLDDPDDDPWGDDDDDGDEDE